MSPNDNDPQIIHYVIPCPRCGGELYCIRNCRVFETVEGKCIDCGFEYHTIASLLPIPKMNKLRIEKGKLPVNKRRPVQQSWVDLSEKADKYPDKGA